MRESGNNGEKDLKTFRKVSNIKMNPISDSFVCPLKGWLVGCLLGRRLGRTLE